MSANLGTNQHRTIVEDFVLNHHVLLKNFQKLYVTPAEIELGQSILSAIKQHWIDNLPTPYCTSSGHQFGTAVNTDCQRLASHVVGGKEELIWTVKFCRNLYTDRHWELGEAYDEAMDDLYDIEVGIEVEYTRASLVEEIQGYLGDMRVCKRHGGFWEAVLEVLVEE